MRKTLLLGFIITMVIATTPIIQPTVAGWGWPYPFTVNISYGPQTFILGETVWVKASCSYSATIELWIYQKVGSAWQLIEHFGPVYNQGQLVGSFLCAHYDSEYKFYAFASPSMGIPDSDTKYAHSEAHPYYETYPYTHPDNQWMIDFALVNFVYPGLTNRYSPETRQAQLEAVCNRLDWLFSTVSNPSGGRWFAWRDIDQVYDYYQGSANPSCEHRMVILMGLLECLAYLGELPIYDIQGCYFEDPDSTYYPEHYFVRGCFWDCTGAGAMKYFFADAYSGGGSTSPDFDYWYWGPQYYPSDFHGYHDKTRSDEDFQSDVSNFGDIQYQGAVWTPKTSPAERHYHFTPNGAGAPYGDGYCIDTIGSSDYGYYFFGSTNEKFVVGSGGTITVSGYMRHDDNLGSLAPGRRRSYAYLLTSSANPTILESYLVLDYYHHPGWYYFTASFTDLDAGEYKIGIGRRDAWSYDWHLEVEWSGIVISVS